MTNEEQQHPITPAKKDRMRPAELLGFSAVLSVFAMLIVLMGTRDWKLALICFGIAFIVVLVVVALAGLGMKPNPEDVAARQRLDGAGEGDTNESDADEGDTSGPRN